MLFRNSTEQDLKYILNILEEAKLFLKNNGVDQWQNGYPNEEVILNDIKNNESYVLEYENEIIGTTVLSFRGDNNYNKIYEGKWITEKEKYAVIHRIAIKKDSGIKNIGMNIMKFIEDKCIENNIHSIKIDTHENNKNMQGLLEKLNYKYCGVIYLEDGNKRIAFEKLLHNKI